MLNLRALETCSVVLSDDCEHHENVKKQINKFKEQTKICNIDVLYLVAAGELDSESSVAVESACSESSIAVESACSEPLLIG